MRRLKAWEVFVVLAVSCAGLTFLSALVIGTAMALKIIPFDGPPDWLFGGLLVAMWLLVAAVLSVLAPLVKGLFK